jgi:hypothetical protein
VSLSIKREKESKREKKRELASTSSSVGESQKDYSV